MLEPENEAPHSILQDYPDIFREVADTLHTTGHDQEALLFYEPLFRNKEGEFTLKSFIGLYTCYIKCDDTENGNKIIEILKDWNAATLDELAILTKFFEDAGKKEEAWQRAETLYKSKGAWRLRKLGYKQYENLLEYFRILKKQARGKGNTKKLAAKKLRTKIRFATGADPDSENEDDTSPKERPSLGPLGERPAKGRGLYRVKERKIVAQLQQFVPVTNGLYDSGPISRPEPEMLEGTGLTVERIEHKLFRDKITNLANNNAEELKSNRAQHREIVTSFARLDELSEPADDGDEAATSEYLSISRELVEEFSTFDLFYSERRQDFKGYFRRIRNGEELWKESALMALAVEANRVEDGEEERNLEEMPDFIEPSFWGVHFDKWMDVFGRYALYLARKNEKDSCFSALNLAMQCNIASRSDHYSEQLELCRMACALAVGESGPLCSAIRVLLRKNPFSSDLVRLYSATNRLCPISDGYGDARAHKAFLRYIKTVDLVLLNPEQREKFNFRGDDNTLWMQTVANSDMLHLVKGHDPALFALYGHMLMASGAYTGALNYYFRAYAITPEDPVVNLSIGVAYIQHAQKRQSENRQFQIQQGLAFMTRYYEIRTKDDVAIHCSEAEFNMGRMWHVLGLQTQALEFYERCIALSDRVRQEAADRCGDDNWEIEDFASEAAFAVQTIYTLSGDFENAQRVTETALVIE
jgi:general transcription factor 3C polypeptide 3 (transcription factor C subunit 4)